MAYYTPSGALVDEKTGLLLKPPPGESSGGAEMPTNTYIQEQTSPGNIINSSSLEQIRANNFQSYTPPPTPSILGLDISMPKLSEPEQKVSDFTKRITDIQNSLLGKTTFTQEQEKLQGTPELQKAMNDLAAQIKGYQLESQSLQNIGATIPSAMEERFAGTGATKAGVLPLTAGELRRNQIQQATIASKALTAAAAFEAIKGNIANAQILIDRAIAAKFGPQEEKLKVELANLDVALKDPSITLAEKNRANAQSLILKKQEGEIAAKKQETADIWKISTDASANIQGFIPTTQYPTASFAIKAIQESKTGEGALLIASQTGLMKSQTGQSDFEQAFLREKGRLPTVSELLDFKQKEAAAGREGEDTSKEAIDAWARRINTGTDKISSVPNNLRNKVVARTKQFAEEDLIEDIAVGLGKGLKQDALVKQLQTAYSEFSKTEIENKVKSTAPIAQPEKKGVFGAIGSFFGSLFR